MITKGKLSEAVDFLSQEFWNKLKEKYISGLGIAGSYARGNYSPSRPDINFIFFVNNDSPELYLIVAQIFNKAANKFIKDFNLRPRSEPERPTSSFQSVSSKPDVFIKISYLLLELRDTPGFPFGRPPFVAESHAKSFKLLYGKNYLTGISGECSNKQIIAGSLGQFRAWNELLKYTPQSYRLPKEKDLFFDESLAYGKLLVQQATWLAGIKKGLNYAKKESREKIIGVVSDKRLLGEYLSCLGKEIQKNSQIILEARLNYEEWKNNLKRGEFIYKASFDLSKALLKIAGDS
jgi:hypothetical protein